MSRRCSWFMSQKLCTTQARTMANNKWFEDIENLQWTLEFRDVQMLCHCELMNSTYSANLQAVNIDSNSHLSDANISRFCTQLRAIAAKTIFKSSPLCFSTRAWEWFRAIKTNDWSLKQFDFRTQLRLNGRVRSDGVEFYWAVNRVAYWRFFGLLRLWNSRQPNDDVTRCASQSESCVRQQLASHRRPLCGRCAISTCDEDHRRAKRNDDKKIKLIMGLLSVIHRRLRFIK